MSAQTLATGSGTYAHSLEVRKDDLYETPPQAVKALLEGTWLPKVIWEPACGPGALVRELEAAGHTVIASDLVDYGWAHDARRDFLMEQRAPADTIVTNPPFKLAEEFAEHANKLCTNVHLLLRLAFLEGRRWDRGLSKGLERVLIFAPRLPFMHRAGYDGPRNSNSGMPFAWFSWRRGYGGYPRIEWTDWRAPAKQTDDALGNKPLPSFRDVRGILK